jgi:predicted dithiol-disulfide oxidoreductase (DUF899 family)
VFDRDGFHRRRAGDLEHHDVSIVAVSRAPLAQIQAAQQRMGWTTPWVSSYDGDFNYDFHVSFRPNDIARGQVFYNYEVTPIPVEDLPGFSGSTRTRTATSSTRTGRSDGAGNT